MRRGLEFILIICILLTVPILSYAANTKPIAQFRFEKQSFQENEPIKAIDERANMQKTKRPRNVWIL